MEDKEFKVTGNRIGIFVDVRGLYFCALHTLGGKVHYGNLLNEITKGRTCVVANVYIVAREKIDQRSFCSALKRYGYNIRRKEERIIEIPGAVSKTKISKVNWYVGMAIDIMELVLKGQLDTICLVAGDGQLADIVSAVTMRNCRCEVYWFGESRCSRLLREPCSMFFELPESIVIKRELKEEDKEFIEVDTSEAESVIDSIEGISEEDIKKAKKEIDEKK